MHLLVSSSYFPETLSKKKPFLLFKILLKCAVWEELGVTDGQAHLALNGWN